MEVRQDREQVAHRLALGIMKAQPWQQMQTKRQRMQPQSQRKAKQLVRVESACLVVKQAPWLLPGRLYPAESWVGIGYIGDGPG